MSFNEETFGLMTRFAVAMVGILLLIWLLACATPYLAKLADKLLGKAKPEQGASSVPKRNPERVEDSDGAHDGAEEIYKVYDIYEGFPSDDNNDKKD